MKNTRPNYMWVDREMHRSLAFLNLSKAAVTILFEFYYRRKFEKQVKDNEWNQTNNGRIIFTYKEAKEKFGYYPSTMAKALSQLVKFGFIDIAHQGWRVGRDCSRYAISDRWKEFKTDKFVEQDRQKDNRKFGFASENWEKITGRKKERRTKKSIQKDSCQLSKGIVISLSKKIVEAR